ncbi:MAG: hypothetical protein NC300_11395 [Bacteroidales bacterium]|nr:hypothetical protein [Clostridium sp.]MCM1204736.1 hypothetical protein [Bacteroidales bacterium]
MGDRWSVYEANLQSYRSMFLSSQSIMLAVGAIITGKSVIATVVVAIVAVFQIIYVWLPVIYYRFLLVDFYKYSMGENFDAYGNLKEEKESLMLTEQIYCKNKDIRKKVNSTISVNQNSERAFSNWRETRKKIDIVIPVSMIMLWIMYVLISIKLI